MLIKSISLISSIFLYLLVLFLTPHAVSHLLQINTTIVDWYLATFSSPIVLSLIMDPYGLTLRVIVLFISANVILFAHSYMMGDPFITRFIQLVLLFIISINLLVFIPNLITLLLGWDGLGLVSFLLVIYYQNPKSLGAGIITALTNRIGDVLILISIALVLNSGSWNLIFTHDFALSSIVSISLICAAITKRAQIPFSSWLPAAIAAPTPVSALVHSSTLVTAGVFLLFRFYPSISLSPYMSPSLLIFATITCLIAGLSANTECDIKKIIALSTLSQLGVIIIRLGMGLPLLAFFHLITHALFKALLFLCAGTLIHLHHHSQDLRFIGNLTLQIPSITSPIIVSNLALCGSPFLAGFYSKDLILEIALFNPYSLVIIILFFFATGLTVRYTLRFCLTVVWGPRRVSPLHPVNDRDIYCSTPTFILASASIFGGAALNWLLIAPIKEPVLPLTLKLLTLFVCGLGLFFGYLLSSNTSSHSATLFLIPFSNLASCTMWFLAPLSTQKMMPFPYYTALISHKTLDQGWEELLGGQGALIISSSLSTRLITPHKRIITRNLSLCFILSPLFILMLY